MHIYIYTSIHRYIYKSIPIALRASRHRAWVEVQANNQAINQANSQPTKQANNKQIEEKISKLSPT